MRIVLLRLVLIAIVLFSGLASAFRQAITSVLAVDDLDRAVTLMARVGSSASPSFSPDGKRIAFVSSLQGIPQVWVMPAEGGFPTLVTASDDPVGFVSWSPDGALLAFNVAPGGGLNEQIYVVKPDGTGLRRLTEGGNGSNFLGEWTHDSRFITFSSNRKAASTTDSYLLDVVTGQMKMVAENRGTGGINDVSRDGKWAVVSRTINRGDNNLFLVHVVSGKESNLTLHDGRATFFGGNFSPDGKTIYFGSNKDRDLIAFARIRFSINDEPGPIEILAARDDAELSTYHINQQGTVAALIWNVAGRSEVAFVDLK